MKKIFVVSALALIMSSSAAMAQGGMGYGQGPDGESRKGERPHHGPDPERMIEHIFERYDMNEDGIISKKEFLKVEEKRFVKMDVDENGSVTKNEVKAGMAARHKEMKERREEMKKPVQADVSPSPEK